MADISKITLPNGSEYNIKDSTVRQSISDISIDSVYDSTTYNVILVAGEGGGGTVTVLPLSVTQNGTYTATLGTAYSPVTVNVSGQSPTIQTLTVTPTESQQTFNSSSVDGYKPVTVDAISSTYVGSGIDRRSDEDLYSEGKTVIVPAGYYSNESTCDVSTATVTLPSSISASSASVSTGTNTLTLTKSSVQIMPTTSIAGYVDYIAASNASVSLTASVTTKASATITPGTTNQTIAAGTYLTGTQTITGDADLVGSNILSTANIFGVQGTVVVQNYYTGSSAPSSSTGSNGDLYLQT